MTSFIAVFVTGPPCAGKSLVSRHLAASYGLEYCSPGDWLRIVRDRAGHLGCYIQQNYTYGCLDPLVTDYVLCKIREAIQLHNGIVIDGFPRTQYQASVLPSLCLNMRFLVLNLANVTADESARRAVTRAWTAPFGSVSSEAEAGGSEAAEPYHAITPEDAHKRYNVYDAHSESLLATLQSLSALHNIDAASDVDFLLEQAQETLDSSQGVLIPTPMPGEHAALGLTPATSMESAVVIQATMSLAGLTHAHRRFVGSHPVSLQREHLAQLVKHRYLASRKMDGERTLLLVMSGRLWVLKRNFQVFRSRWCLELLPHEATLLDAELIYKSNSCCVIDAMSAAAGSAPPEAPLSMHPILRRLDAVRHLVPLLPPLLGCASAFMQRYYALADLRAMAQQVSVLPNSEQETDGIILTPQSLPYHWGRDANAYKWKPLHYNTVDVTFFGGGGSLEVFVRKGDGAGGETAYLSVGCISEQDYLSLPRPIPENVGIVLEVLPANEAATWRVIKARGDKTDCNADWVYSRILASIRENITIEELCNLEGVR